MTDPTPAAVEARGLARRYGETTALCLDELALAAGRVHVIVGHNGAGKTTLLRLVAGIDAPDEGTVRVLGTSFAEAGRAGTLALRRRIALAAQQPYLFGASVRRNVEYPLAARGVPPEERRRRAEAAMQRLGVGRLAERDARTLSAGETRRTAIARAVVSRPEVLLLDEPLGGVAPESVALVEGVIGEVVAEGATVVATTHDLGQAYRLSANVVRLEAGRIAPPAVENLVEGTLAREGAETVLVLPGGCRIVLAGDRACLRACDGTHRQAPGGRVRAAIRPGDIVLSAAPFDSSARNALAGRVTALRERDGLVLVAADVGVELTSSVTLESVRRLNLTVGSDVVLTFKATAVEVFGG